MTLEFKLNNQGTRKISLNKINLMAREIFKHLYQCTLIDKQYFLHRVLVSQWISLIIKENLNLSQALLVTIIFNTETHSTLKTIIEWPLFTQTEKGKQTLNRLKDHYSISNCRLLLPSLQNKYRLLTSAN